jgi:aspartate kinase
VYKDFSKSSRVVQKYGGTSVGTPERILSVAERVARQHKDGWRNLAIVVSAMSGETNRLVALMKAVNPNVSPQYYDMAIAAGEQVSVALLAGALEKHGVRADMFLAYQLGIMTDEFHAKARIQEIKTEKIYQSWASGRIPVIAGFQGVTDKMEITTLGRGGSDTSAVAMAVALDAAFCEINTDVDGVYSADPRIVPGAKLIETMEYEVALEMASLGSKVLHSRCVEIGAKFKMPITVRNSFKDDDSQRTRIMAESNKMIESAVVSGVTLDRNVARLTLSNVSTKVDAFSTIFSAVAKHGVNVDIIVHDRHKSEPTKVGFTIAKDELALAEKALGAIRQRADFAKLDYQVETNLAKVSIVGVGMRSHPGVASKAFEVLANAGIEIQMISTSEIKVSCVIDETHGDDAMRALHKGFLES